MFLIVFPFFYYFASFNDTIIYNYSIDQRSSIFGEIAPNQNVSNFALAAAASPPNKLPLNDVDMSTHSIGLFTKNTTNNLITNSSIALGNNITQQNTASVNGSVNLQRTIEIDQRNVVEKEHQDYTEEDLAAFSSDKFTFRHIPRKAPSTNLC